MKKRRAVICLCFIGGCILVGVVIAGVFQMKPNLQPRNYSIRELNEEEKEEAIKIALDDTSVKEKFEGLEYRIAGVLAFENLTTREKLEPQVLMYINGTAICYAAKVNLSEKRVTEISESNCGDEVGREKSAKAIKIALNDSRVKEKMKGRDYAATARQKLIEKRLLVDVYIEMEEPPMTYIATVDPEEGKVIEIGEK